MEKELGQAAASELLHFEAVGSMGGSPKVHRTLNLSPLTVGVDPVGTKGKEGQGN